MSWWEEALLGFDSETTGVDVTTDRIVTACVIHPTDAAENWLINPGVDIPTAASDIHGVTTAIAQRDGVDPARALDEIAGSLAVAWNHNVPVVAFNACFDLSILDHELARHRLPTLVDRLGGNQILIVDPLVIDRHIDKYRRGKRTLTAVCAHYGVTLDDAHTADADATAAVELARKIGASHPQIGNIPPQALHELQRRWHREQAASRQAYFDRQGKDEQVNTQWPLIPAPSVPQPPAVVRALELMTDELWCANAGITDELREVIVDALRDKAVAA